MPLGLQLIGRPHRELDLLQVAAWCEEKLEFPKGPKEPYTP
jgi:Asp-tRNA(Asn)/Glu-tRNA(Gln) amidotransferase A subunit family amidase